MCQTCEKPFGDGQEFYTLLSLNEEDEYERADVCDVCWNEEEERPKAVSIWKSVFRFPPPKPEEALKKETTETLLRKLMETEEERQRDVIFVLAVDLERRRIFVERDIELLKNGEKRRIYEHKETSEVFVIHDPNLNLRELENVQGRVLELLIHKEDSARKAENEPEK